MTNIRFGCQAYPWQMAGNKYVGKISHILNTISRSAYAGFELEKVMLGDTTAAELSALLAMHKIELAAICLALEWKYPKETESEIQEADMVFSYLSNFPESLLILCQLPGKNRYSLRERQKNAIACVNAVAKRAKDCGIRAAFHPNSPPGSVFRTADDYEFLLNNLDANALGFAPDAGHIAKGGMDPLSIIKLYHSLVKHVHFKDMGSDGHWKLMGKGLIDFAAITEFLVHDGYRGWIVVEDESSLAETNPDRAIKICGDYVRTLQIQYYNHLVSGNVLSQDK